MQLIRTLSSLFFFFFGCTGFLLLHGLSLVVASRDCSSCTAWASHCGDICCGAQALEHVGFSSCGKQA